jgi:lysophospholipase L1-like esterase
MRKIVIIMFFLLISASSACLANGIVFLGDSLTSQGDWGSGIINMGVSGDTTTDILNRLGDVSALKPDKVFIMAGINDIDVNEKNKIFPNYKKIFSQISTASPRTKIYLLSILPVNNIDCGSIFSNSEISRINDRLKKLAPAYGGHYIDLYSLFIKDGQLAKEYTTDGVHLNQLGYLVWKTGLNPYL